MADRGRSHVQLCGRLVARIEGARIDQGLPGRNGRLLFAFLVLNRERAVDRDELAEAVWAGARREVDAPLNVLLSRLRRVVGPELLRGRAQLELRLPSGTTVDVETAIEGLHRAESHIREAEWADAWGPAGVAYHIASRPLLPGIDRPWLDERRRMLADVSRRGLECFAASALGIGALGHAERVARLLIETEPYRETGHRLLMDTLEAQDNVAEGLLAYERLRVLLRDELGVAPSPALQATHRRLLGRRHVEPLPD